MSIHYKFRSAREYDTITVDGGFISLFDLKKAIIEAKKLGKSMDLDLEVVNAQTNEAYTDESTLIPKNTSVIVRRVPTTKMASIVQPASAPTHVAVMQEKPIEVPAPQQPQMQYTQQYAPVQPQVAPLVVPTESGTPNVGGEEDRIMALINQADDWHATGTTKDTGMTPGGHRGGGKFTRQYEQKTPPPNYICHRCNQPGHFINQCPTNGDPSFDIPKVKKPTGIPRMYLKPVAGGDSRPSLILPGGQFAVMAANEEALQKEVAKNKQVDTSIPDSLRCPLCGGLLNDAVLIPCCGYSFCEECIRPQYPNDVINCPMCHKASSASRLVPNLTLRTAVEQFKKSRDEMKVNRIISQRPPEVPRTMPSGPAMPLRSIPTVVSDTPVQIMPLPSVVPMPVKTEVVQSLPTAVTDPTATTGPLVEEVQLDGNDSPPYSPSKGLADDGSEDKSPRAKSPGSVKDEKPEDKENKDNKDDKRGDDKNYQNQGQYQYNNYYGQYPKGGRYCFVCGSPAHQARECPNRQAIEAAYSAYGYYMDPAAAAYYGAAYPGYGYDPRMQGYQDDWRRRRRSRSPRGRSRSPRGRSPRRSPRRSRSRGRSGDRRRRSPSRDRGTKRKRSTSREDKRDDKSKRARTDDKDRKDDKSSRDDKAKKDDRKDDKSKDDKERASSKDTEKKSEPKPSTAEEVTKMDIDESKEQEKESSTTSKSKPKEEDRRSRDEKDRRDPKRDEGRKEDKKDERRDRDDKDRRTSDKRDDKDRKEERRDPKKDERKEDKKEEKRDHAERKDEKPKSDKHDEKKDSKSDRREERKEDKPRAEKKDERRDERKEESRKEDKKDKRDDKKDDRRSSDKRDQKKEDKSETKKEDKRDDKKDDRRDKRDERKDDKKDDRRDDRRDSKKDDKKDDKKDERRDDKRTEAKKDERRDGKKSSDKKEDKSEPKKEDKREGKKDENPRKRKLDESGSSTGSAAKKPRLESAVRVVQMSSDREDEPRVKIIPPDHTLKERENKEKRKSLIHEILTGRRDKEDKEKLRKSGEKKDDKKEREVVIISPKNERKNKDLKRSEERRDRRR